MPFLVTTRQKIAVHASCIAMTIVGIALLPIVIPCIAIILVFDRPKPYGRNRAEARSIAATIALTAALVGLGMLDAGSDPCGYFAQQAACVALN